MKSRIMLGLLLTTMLATASASISASPSQMISATVVQGTVMGTQSAGGMASQMNSMSQRMSHGNMSNMVVQATGVTIMPTQMPTMSVQPSMSGQVSMASMAPQGPQGPTFSCEAAKNIKMVIDGPAISMMAIMKNGSSPNIIFTGGEEGPKCATFKRSTDGQNWVDLPKLSTIPSGQGILLPNNIMVKVVSKACGDHGACYGDAAIKFRVIGGGMMGSPGDMKSFASNNASEECVARAFLFPDVTKLKCATCDLKQNFSLNFNEDSGCTGFTLSQYIDHKGNDNDTQVFSKYEHANFTQAFNSSLRADFLQAINTLTGGFEKYIEVKGVDGLNVKWFHARNSTSKLKRVAGNTLIPQNDYICLRPDKDFHGNRTIEFHCVFKSKATGKVVARSAKATKFLIKVNSVPDRAEMKKPIFNLPHLSKNFNLTTTNGTLASVITAAAASHPDSTGDMGVAIIAQGTTDKGVWEAECNGAWRAINKTGGNTYLVKADARIRFRLTGDNYWTRSLGARSIFLAFKTWDMTDNSTCGVQTVNMSASTAFSEKRGQITQLRYGCHGPGTDGGADDACGVCGGDGSTCTGCDNVAVKDKAQRAKYDMCGNCTGGSTNKAFGFFLDCYNTCGKFINDSCGYCQKKGARYNADKYKDCAGVCGGKAKINKCGHCAGGNTGNATTQGQDACGVCGGNGQSCKDCDGVANGPKTVDICGVCNAPDASNRDSCTKLANPPKLCLKVASNTIKVPAAGLSGMASVACSVGGIAVTSATISANKKTVDIVTASVASAVSGSSASLNLSCVFTPTAGSVVTLDAPNNTLFYKESGIGLTSLSPAEATATMTTQNITITGTNFVDSGFLKCAIKKQSGNIAVPATFLSATQVRCEGVPGSMKSVAYEISVDTCGTGQFDDSKKLTFTFTKPMPAVSNAKFATCTTFMVRFAKPIGSVSKPLICDHFFNSTSNQTALGSQYKCGMAGPFAIKVSMRGSPTFTSGGKLRINYRALEAARAAKTSYATDDEVITVGPPSNAPNPNVGVMPRGEIEIGSCDKYTVRALSKIRGGLTYAWNVSCASGETCNGAAATALDTLRGNVTAITAPRLSIAGDSALVGKKLAFTVTVTDCFGNTASAESKITKVNKNLPNLLVTTPKVTTRSNRITRIRTKTSLGCAAGASLVYTWETSPAVSGLTTNKRELFVPAGILTAGTTYTATVTVAQLADPSLYATGSAQITVTSMALKGSVKGPASVGSTGSIVLKTRTEDPDQSSDTLSFQWNVFDSNGDGVLHSGSPINLGQSSAATIEGNKLTAGETYTVQVTFTKGQRTLTASQSVTVIAGSPAQVVTEPPLDNVNPSGKVLIFSTIKSTVAGSFAWSAVDMGDDAAYGFLDLTDSSNYFGAISGSYGLKDRFTALVIRPDVMEGGVSYKFQLTATNSDGVASSAPAVITTNAAPTQGVLSASANSGTAMETEFTFSVPEGCVDDDGADFTFGYTVGSGATLKTVTYPTTTDSEYTTTLGQGTLNLFVRCTDPSGAFAYTDGVTVTTSAPTIDSSFVDAQSSKMTELANSGNSEELAAFAMQFLETASAAAGDESAEVTAFKASATTNMVAEIPTTAAAKNNLANSLATSTAGGSENFDAALITTVGTALSDMLSGSGSKRRRRRAVDHANLNAMTPTEGESYLTTQGNLVSPTAYDSSSMSTKTAAIQAVDDVAASMCKSYSQGESRVIAKSDLAVVNVVQQDFSTVNTTYLECGCPGTCGTCSNCPSWMTGADEVLLGQALLDDYISYSCSDAAGASATCAGACVTSSIFQNDLRSTSQNTSRLSNVNRVQLYNPLSSATLAVSSLSSPMKVKMATTANTTNSYLCVRWDSSSTSWVTTGVTTDDIVGVVDGGVYYVTCTLSTLADVMVIEGPEIVVTTTAAATTTVAATTVTTVTTQAATVATTVNAADNTAQNVKFSFDIPCAQVFTEANKTTVTANMKTAVANALGISESTMTSYAISCGSTVNEWVQNSAGLPAGKTVKSVVDGLKASVDGGSFTITVNGMSLPPKAGSFTAAVVPAKASSGLSTGALAGIAVGAALLVIIMIIVIVVCCKKMKKKGSKVGAGGNDLEMDSRQNSAHGKKNPGYNDSP